MHREEKVGIQGVAPHANPGHLEELGRRRQAVIPA